MKPEPLTGTDLSERLRRVLPTEPLSLLQFIAALTRGENLPLYIVGGFVRDLLLGIPSTDFDLVTEGDVISLARKVAAAKGGKLTVHARFRTAQWEPPAHTTLPRFMDFISARSETYKKPAALPTVSGGSLMDDLLRRDFSINTLAIRLDGDHFGELQDALGGWKDLQRGQIRVLHPRSFRDDPTRLFRAVRYEQRYDFHITTETQQLIPEALPLIGNLSAERLRHELDLILEEEKAASILGRLDELSILTRVDPALRWNEAARERFSRGMAGFHAAGHPGSRLFFAWAFWLMVLPASFMERIDQRLGFRADQRKNLLGASELYKDVSTLSGLKPSQAVARLEAFPRLAIEAVSFAQPEGELRQVLENYLSRWRHVRPRTTGQDLIRLGLPQGPLFRSILNELRNAWLDGRVKTPAEEKQLLHELINSKQINQHP